MCGWHNIAWAQGMASFSGLGVLCLLACCLHTQSDKTSLRPQNIGCSFLVTLYSSAVSMHLCLSILFWSHKNAKNEQQKSSTKQCIKKLDISSVTHQYPTLQCPLYIFLAGRIRSFDFGVQSLWHYSGNIKNGLPNTHLWHSIENPGKSTNKNRNASVNAAILHAATAIVKTLNDRGQSLCNVILDQENIWIAWIVATKNSKWYCWKQVIKLDLKKRASHSKKGQKMRISPLFCI